MVTARCNLAVQSRLTVYTKPKLSDDDNDLKPTFEVGFIIFFLPQKVPASIGSTTKQQQGHRSVMIERLSS